MNADVQTRQVLAALADCRRIDEQTAHALAHHGRQLRAIEETNRAALREIVVEFRAAYAESAYRVMAMAENFRKER